MESTKTEMQTIAATVERECLRLSRAAAVIECAVSQVYEAVNKRDAFAAADAMAVAQGMISEAADALERGVLMAGEQADGENPQEESGAA